MAPRIWLDLELERVGEDVQVRGLGSRGERPEPHVLAPRSALEAFARRVEEAALAGASMDEEDGLAAEAEGLYRGVFQGQLQEVWLRLREAAGDEPLLLRWVARGLEGLPLEALKEPGLAGGYLGLSPAVVSVRGVRTPKPWQPREVLDAVRVLAVAPLHEAELRVLRGALHQAVEDGEVEWLEPVKGPQAQPEYLHDRLSAERTLHVLHFAGHLGLDEQGRPVMQVAAPGGGRGQRWMPVEDLAASLEMRFKRDLRLVVLQACEGAKPGAVASAAELLVQKGADAVVAHLWKVRSDVAEQAAKAFYRALARGEQQRGDVAASLGHARQTVWSKWEHAAEAFSPVLYLRGQEPALFDFGRRKVARPVRREAGSAVAAGLVALEPALERLLEQRFSLVLGDGWRAERHLHDGLRVRLQEELRAAGAPPADIPMSAVAQRYLMHFGEKGLNLAFQEASQDAVEALRESFARGGGDGDAAPPERGGEEARALPLAGALAGLLAPGVHVTLMRLPVLELALARRRPELTLYVVQPGEEEGEPATVMRRRAGETRWERLPAGLPASVDLEREVLVLRLYSGYLPANLFFSRPLLAEDHYLHGGQGLRRLLAPDLAESCLKALRERPALLVGMSVLAWHHRMVLHQLFERHALPPGSVGLLEPGDAAERKLWEAGKGLPGSVGLRMVETDGVGLTELLEARGGEAA